MKKRSTTYRLNKVDYAIFIIFSIAAAVMLYLFYSDLNSFTIKQSEEPVAKIYFKRNTAQRKFIDNDIWEVLTNSSDIYDGDRIRTSRNSEAYTEFNDTGIQIQLREKSMIQIFKNKKERSVDFIGGEIFVANNSSEEKVIIHSAKKEIAITQPAEVKITLPDVSEAAAAGEQEAEVSPVIVEVVSGQVEIKEETVAAPKAKAEKVEPEPIVVTAGETVTLVPVVEKEPEPVVVEPEPVVETPAVEEVEPEPVVEEIAVVEAVVEAAAEEPAAKVKETVAVTETPKVEPAPTPAPVPVVEEKSEEPSPAAFVKPEDLYEPVEYRVEKTTTRKVISLNRNNWYDEQTKENKHNYYFNIKSSEVLGASRKVPKNSTIMLEISGVPNNDVREIIIEMTTGSQEWTRAHPWFATIPDYGRGLIKDQQFNIKRYFTITSDIVNTNTSTLGICYDPDKLDQPLTINDFQIKATVLPEGVNGVTSEINWKFAKTLNYDTIVPRKEVWGKGSRDYNYRVEVNGDAVFGNNINVPKGKKVKVTISGVTDKTIQRFHLELIDNTEEKWTQVFMFKNDNDWSKLNFSENPTYKGRNFKYTKTYTFNQALLDSNFTKLSLVVDNDGLKDAPVFTDLQIDMVLE